MNVASQQIYWHVKHKYMVRFWCDSNHSAWLGLWQRQAASSCWQKTVPQRHKHADRQVLFGTAVPAVQEKLVLTWMVAACLAKQASAAWSTPDCSARTQTSAVLSSAPPPDVCKYMSHSKCQMKLFWAELSVRCLVFGSRCFSQNAMLVSRRELTTVVVCRSHAHWIHERWIMWALSGMLSMQTLRRNNLVARPVQSWTICSWFNFHAYSAHARGDRSYKAWPSPKFAGSIAMIA